MCAMGVLRQDGGEPLWLEEGLAVLFEEGLRSGAPVLLPDRLADLADPAGGAWGLEELLNLAELRGNSAAERSRFYASSWYLVYWLVRDRPAAFALFLLDRGVLGERQAFELHLGRPEDLEPAWRAALAEHLRGVLPAVGHGP